MVAQEVLKHRKYDAICAATGSHFSPFELETTGGHGASTATVYLLFAEQLRDSGLPADVLVSKLKKDISFAFRRGTIAQGTKALTLPSAPSRMRRLGFAHVTTHNLEGYACPACRRG